MKKLQAIGVAFAAAGAAGVMIYVGLKHGYEGYEAQRERQRKRRAQEKKRESRTPKGPRR